MKSNGLILPRTFESNDHRLLVSLAETGEGTVLGRHHLVHLQISEGIPRPDER
jgi:hypothetical protein